MGTLAPSIFCKTRPELLNRLANIVEQLGKSKVQLGTLSSSDLTWQCQLESEVKHLRDEYRNIKGALESQRTANESRSEIIRFSRRRFSEPDVIKSF